MKGQNYTREFRGEAIKLVTEQGQSHRDAAKRLGIPTGTLSNWVQASKRGQGPAPTAGSQSVGELQAENARLRKELARAEMERE